MVYWFPRMDETTAYHEAGHAFAASWLGARVRSVTIEPDWDDGPERCGATQVEWDYGRFTQREVCEKSILVALAGPVAEAIHRGEPYHPGVVPEWASDWRTAWEATAILSLPDRARLEYLENVSVQLYRLINRDEVWAAIAAIVDSLQAHDRLEGDEIDDIVEVWLS